MKKLLVCVGYDSREDIAYQVCRHSIYRRSTLPIEIYPLKHKELRDRGIFWRPWLTAGSGQTVDCIDGRPFSTAFSHTRFLTSHMLMINFLLCVGSLNILSAAPQKWTA